MKIGCWFFSTKKGIDNVKRALVNSGVVKLRVAPCMSMEAEDTDGEELSNPCQLLAPAAIIRFSALSPIRGTSRGDRNENNDCNCLRLGTYSVWSHT